MEVSAGVFTSNIDTDEWEHDSEVGGLVHVLAETERAQAGMSRFDTVPEQPVTYTPPGRETIVVLQGTARIDLKDGPSVTVRAGDIASFPEGVEATWNFLEVPFKEVWVLA
jgi:uncharacterized cupin superfamily protein